MKKQTDKQYNEAIKAYAKACRQFAPKKSGETK